MTLLSTQRIHLRKRFLISTEAYIVSSTRVQGCRQTVTANRLLAALRPMKTLWAAIRSRMYH